MYKVYCLDCMGWHWYLTWEAYQKSGVQEFESGLAFIPDGL